MQLKPWLKKTGSNGRRVSTVSPWGTLSAMMMASTPSLKASSRALCAGLA
jgi:hypothetical protein